MAIRNLRTPALLVRYTDIRPDMSADDLWRGIQGSNPSKRRTQRAQTSSASGSSSPSASRGRRPMIARTPSMRFWATTTMTARAARGAALGSRPYGQTRREDRERLIAVFNTPFAPDILVASSVMGEGIDLHHECRHVIHHNPDWNPSRLEQRTGRLDRIGALAERVGKDIEVYEPFLAGTHTRRCSASSRIAQVGLTS
ncbi:helicase-related protein [Nocardioides hungaricus]